MKLADKLFSKILIFAVIAIWLALVGSVVNNVYDYTTGQKYQAQVIDRDVTRQVPGFRSTNINVEIVYQLQNGDTYKLEEPFGSALSFNPGDVHTISIKDGQVVEPLQFILTSFLAIITIYLPTGFGLMLVYIRYFRKKTKS